MEQQDINKGIIDAIPPVLMPLSEKFIAKLSISLTKEDPIDRDEACCNDGLDCLEEIIKTIIQQYSVFFVDPNSCRESFRLAIAAEKLRVHQQANQARNRRDETAATGRYSQ